jgi:predicted dehydrogenase
MGDFETMEQNMNRRQFMTRSIRGATSLSVGMAVLSMSSARVIGANERPNVALIGCGGRGSYVARGMTECGAEITCLCDLHQERLNNTAKFLADAQQRKPKLVKEMRQVFDAKDIDAVIVATPDHWHTPASILACQAGKDVYVEKPQAHSIWECGKLIEAARRYKRIVQVGTQNRSAEYNKAALEYVKSGKLGKIHLVKVYNLKAGGPFHLGEPGTAPAGFDWDAWVGPAPARPYHQHIFHGGWHKFWDFSGGDDIAIMMMGDPGMPKAVSCTGGRMAYKGDDSEVPDVQIATYEFDDFVMTFELTGYPKYMRKTSGTIRRNDVLPYWTQNATRVELYGSELMMTIGRHGGGWQVTTGGGQVVEQMYGRPADTVHEKDFIESVKSRKMPNADAGVISTACNIVHMGNIAHRVGNRKLWFDSKTGRFIDNAKANELLKRNYRNKYKVPEQV